MNAELILFWCFAIGTIAGASGVMIARNPIASAMSLVGTFFFLAGIYVLLWAHTIAAMQVMVYAGAIMVLFLFVIMLLSLTDTGPAVKLGFSRYVGAIGVAGLLGGLVHAFLKMQVAPGSPAWMSSESDLRSFGSIERLGEVLYTQWLFPFEAVSLLLLVAIVGAVVVAKSRI